jgi:predicted ATP-dependent Lon-type protease
LYGPKIELSLAQTKEKLTANQWIELVAKEIGTEPKIQKIPTWMIHILGLSIPFYERISRNDASIRNGLFFRQQ